eukprot:SAG11_NODE_1279_length_5314_cov_3.403835_7_plen_147_part_00
MLATIVRLGRGDISRWPAAAITVSTNLTLSPNDNVSYWRFNGRTSTNTAVHAAAGPELRTLCRAVPPSVMAGTRCAVGTAVVTASCGELAERCEHVIHACAPDGLYGCATSEPLLKITFAQVLKEASALRACSVAVPALGCGVNGW